MNKIRNNHLRLVSNNSGELAVEQKGVISTSVTPLVDNEKALIKVILVNEVEAIQEGDFLNFLRGIDARCVFDTRVAPRLDFIAPHRSIAFKRFSELGVDYIDMLSGSIEGDEVSSFHRELSALFANVSKYRPGEDIVWVFLFDRPETLFFVRDALSAIDDRLVDAKVRTEYFCEQKLDLIAM